MAKTCLPAGREKSPKMTKLGLGMCFVSSLISAQYLFYYSAIALLGHVIFGEI
jgi:hypothetical protein